MKKTNRSNMNTAPGEIKTLKAELPQSGGAAPVPVKLLAGRNADGSPRYVTAQIPRDALPKVGVVELKLAADGTVIPVWDSWSPRIRLTKDIGERLKLDVSWFTIRVWMKAGFVRGEVMGNVTWLDIGSLRQFMRDCSASAETSFWTPERWQQLKDAYDEVHASGLRPRRIGGSKPGVARVEAGEDDMHEDEDGIPDAADDYEEAEQFEFPFAAEPAA